MSILTSPEELPQKIQRHITGEYHSDFIAAFKTNIKPNATIPILWVIFYNNGLLFCNTHKTRGLYRDIKISEIDSFKLNISEYTPPVVQIIFKDIHESDYFIESPKGTDSKKLLDILNSLKTQVL